jgi:hypothetical protein
MRLIPLASAPSQRFTIVLDGRDCTIALAWRQERLYLDLDVGAEPVCRGAICQNRADVLQSRSPLFSGALHFLDLQGERAPRWDGLCSESAGRWALFHVPAGETLPAGLRY